MLLGLAAPLRYARWPQTLRADLLVSIVTYLPALTAVPELAAVWRRRMAEPRLDEGTDTRSPDRSCP